MDCPFCGWEEDPSLCERLILETTGFVVVAGLGQIVPGYVNIFLKRHATCFAELTVPELAEFAVLCRQLEDAFVGVYQKWPVLFEHGISGQTVKHAHAHLVPLAHDCRLAMHSRLCADYTDYTQLAGWKVFAHVRDRFQNYLLFSGTHGDDLFVFSVAPAAVVSGYLRGVLAEIVGAPEWADWREVDPKLDAIRWQETRDLLRAYLETAGIPL